MKIWISYFVCASHLCQEWYMWGWDLSSAYTVVFSPSPLSALWVHGDT